MLHVSEWKQDATRIRMETRCYTYSNGNKMLHVSEWKQDATRIRMETRCYTYSNGNKMLHVSEWKQDATRIRMHIYPDRFDHHHQENNCVNSLAKEYI